MKKTKFKTKNEKLTPYALACGYIEQKELSGVRVTLWHEGGPLYQVRAHDFNTHTRLFWESFEKLTDARKCYDKAEKTIMKINKKILEMVHKGKIIKEFYGLDRFPTMKEIESEIKSLKRKHKEMSLDYKDEHLYARLDLGKE